MSVLLIAEHNNKEIKPFTLNAITAALQIDQELNVLVIGNKAEVVAKSISSIPKVKKVIHIDDQIYETMRLQNKLLREENRKIKVERNKAIRQLESIKKKLLKLGDQ